MRPFKILIAAAACAALSAAPAGAAYAPRLEVAVDPPTAGRAVSVSVALTQAASEEATRSLRVTLPGFAAAPGAQARPACTGAAASSGRCPPESRVGSATSATTFGDFQGGVHHAGAEGDAQRLLVVLGNPLVPLLLDQRFTGTLSPVPGGRELSFEDLPGATATRLRVVLDGGDRALLAAPDRCAAYELLGRLTSHGGERSDRSSRVTIGGCPGRPPAISGLALARRRVRAPATTALSFSLSGRAAVRVTVRRSGTRRVRTIRTLRGRAGRNRIAGVGRGLAPGRWFVRVRAADGDGATARTVALRVLPRRR